MIQVSEYNRLVSAIKASSMPIGQQGSKPGYDRAGDVGAFGGVERVALSSRFIYHKTRRKAACCIRSLLKAERRNFAMTHHIHAVFTDRAPAAIGPYSQAVESAGFLFISGQLGLDPKTGEFAGRDFASQARQALNNIQAILEGADITLRDVTAVDVFVTDLANFQEFNEIYSEFFRGHKPARAVVQVSGLPKGGLVEIKAIARKEPEKVY
jgi:2-iminobutanoate/2-iminopropanoate deaminase